MGIISEVKCGRCDRRYSGLRSRCPYCGARRSQRGKRAADGDNNKWKFIIGLLLLLILIVAVVVLVVTSLAEKKAGEPNQGQETSGDVSNSNDGVTNIEDSGDNSAGSSGDTSADTSADTSGDTSAEPSGAAAIESFVITYQGSEIAYEGYDTDYEISMSQGDVLTLGYKTTPENAELKDGDAVWSSSDTNSVVVLQTGEVTAVGSSSATVTLTIGSLSKTVYVRIG